MEGRDNLHLYRVGWINFPKFSGVDVSRSMFSQALHYEYFEVNETPKEAKPKFAIIHLEREALQWHQGFVKLRASKGKVGAESMSKCYKLSSETSYYYLTRC